MSETVNRKIALAYQQAAMSFDVQVSGIVRANLDLPSQGQVLNLSDYQTFRPDLVRAALLGSETGTLSTILGRHPDFPQAEHPVHKDILRSLITRTAEKLSDGADLIQTDNVEGSVAIIGGPKASEHAALLFGWGIMPSVLGAELPVHFKAHGEKISLVVDGRDVWDEHFVLTSLPMGQQRLLNISALSGMGGSAAELILGDERLLHDLFVRTRSFSTGGWQALFKVSLREKDGQLLPRSVDRAFHVLEIKGVDFGSAGYPLNESEFLLNPKNLAERMILPRESQHPPFKIKDSVTKQQLAEVVKNFIPIKSGSVVSSKGLKIEARIHAQALLDAIGKDPDLRQDPILKELAGKISPAFGRATSRSREPLPEAFANKPRWSDEMKKTKAHGRRNPAQFIREEYGPEIEMPQLLRADDRLYHAYAVWIRPGRHPEDDLNLKTRAQLTDATEMLEATRKRNREASRRYRAKAISKNDQ